MKGRSSTLKSHGHQNYQVIGWTNSPNINLSSWISDFCLPKTLYSREMFISHRMKPILPWEESWANTQIIKLKQTILTPLQFKHPSHQSWSAQTSCLRSSFEVQWTRALLDQEWERISKTRALLGKWFPDDLFELHDFSHKTVSPLILIPSTVNLF